MTRTGAQVLVDQLVVHGVEAAFCIPGESYIAVLDALHDAPIRLVVARHEAGAANMADAYGKLTGRPGICFVTRAPGATHAAVGVHAAYQDSTPLILFVGQVPRGHRGREAFQELDYGRMFGQMAKWVVEVEEAAAFPEVAARALHVATSGRPGPVVVALPEDVLSETSDVADAARYHPARTTLAPEDADRVRDLLAEAERPLVVVGGGGWTAEAAVDLQAWAEASRLPVATSFRRQDYVDNTSPSYAGVLTIGHDPALASRLRESDLLLALGTRLGEIATRGYTTLEPPRTPQTLVHVHADPNELGRVYEPDLPIVSGSPEFLAGMRALEPLNGSRWADWTAAAHAGFQDWLCHRPRARGVDLADVLAHLRERLPPDAIVTNGAGNFTVWVHRFYTFRRYRTQLSPCSGAMGYGVPAAVAAKVVHPERIVVCVAGDGDFLMSGHELAAAAQERAPIVVLLVNNGMYGTIRMHQERQFPGRVIGTDLVNPDFVGLAEAYGAHAELVERTEDFADAFERALRAGRAAVLELRVDPELITPRATLSAIRAGTA
ncbi:MAG: thiamine pyrophosphate-binding protein [Actinobacteria bacterium]|nr:MAG: thiamine pyrophosphate-binding protein [Actinomycetota bacterium]TMM26917.1 MAG: thiamine pyrophosphate-binding protein [Actinomycetota bacterium]